MSDAMLKAIEEIEGVLREKEREINEMKKTVNSLCRHAGMEPRYADAEMQSSNNFGAIRPDQFYGKPLATAVREILERRKMANLGACSTREIYDVLKGGGYAFEAKDENNAIRILAISLAKNTLLFHKLPHGHFGLASWYPGVKDSKKKLSESSEEGNGTKKSEDIVEEEPA